MIKINNVTKIYRQKNNDFYALKDVSINIHEGETIGIVGYSGAGKSTLIRLMNGLISPDKGEIIVDGLDINKINKKTLNGLRMKMPMVFQHFNLLAQSTVYNNIKEALVIAKYDKNAINERIEELLEAVELLDQRDKYPAALSGGQKQRVGIARALANNPKYLLLDEATSALDIKTSFEIVKLLKKIKEKYGITIIFISHQMEIIKELCERIVVMHDGTIIEDNSAYDIFISPKEEVTKSLIKQIVLDTNKDLFGLYQIIYTKDVSEKPILSQIMKSLDVEISIIHAKMVEVNNDNIGYLYVKMTGSEVNEAIEKLRKENLKVSIYEPN